MLDQWIEARVFRDDVKEAARIFCCELAEMKGHMEVQRIRAGRFEHDVFTARAELLHCKYELDRELGVLGAEEDDDAEMLVLDQVERLDMNVLEIDQDVVGVQQVLQTCRMAEAVHCLGSSSESCLQYL